MHKNTLPTIHAEKTKHPLSIINRQYQSPISRKYSYVRTPTKIAGAMYSSHANSYTNMKMSSIGNQCSAQVFKRAGCHLKRAHLVWWTDHQKGTISAVNWRKRAHLVRRTEEKGNYYGGERTIKEAQHNQLCVDNKKDKTELKATCDWH